MKFTRRKDDHCSFCHYKCSGKAKLELHMRTHTGEKPFFCDQCQHRCSSAGNLRLHIRTVHQGIKKVLENKYKCPLCPYATQSRSVLKIHTTRHTGERAFPCQHPGCGYAGKTSIDIRSHTNQRHKTVRNFVCPFPGCDYRGTTRKVFKRHYFSHNDFKPFVCDVDGCSYRAKRKDSITGHQREVHHDGHKPFACSKCNYRTTSKLKLRVHETTHAEEKSIKCDFSGCSYACKSKNNLRNHVLSRHQDKTFKCDFEGCSAVAASRQALRVHQKHKHCEKVHKCPSCDYRAVYPSLPKLHIDAHNASQRIPCPIKGCTFLARHRNSLTTHMRLHKANLDCPTEACGQLSSSKSAWKPHMKFHDPTGRPFRCPICPKHFARRGDISRHLQSHTKEKPIKCPLCNFGTKCKVIITNHVRSMHSRALPEFYYDETSVCDHCNVNFGCTVGLAMHEMKLKTGVVVLNRLQLIYQ